MKNVNLLFFLLLSVFACKKDAVKDEFPYLGKIKPCDNYQSFKIDGNSADHFYDFVLFNNHFVFFGDDKIVVKPNLSSSPVFEYEEIFTYVNKAIEINGKLIFCADKGVFELDESFNFRTVLDFGCDDIELFDDKVLFTGGLNRIDSIERRGANIMTLDVENNSFDFYTNPVDTNLNCFLDKMLIVGNEIWVTTLGGPLVEIFKFSKNKFEKRFSNENNSGFAAMEFPGGTPESTLFYYEGSMYYHTHSGSIEYFLKNEGAMGEFELIQQFELKSEQSDLESELVTDAANLIKVVGDELYMGATRGLFKFNINSNFSEFELVRDTFLPSQHITGFHIDEFDNQHYLITNYKNITQIDCN